MSHDLNKSNLRCGPGMSIPEPFGPMLQDFSTHLSGEMSHWDADGNKCTGFG